MRVGRLTSDDRNLIWNMRTQKGWGSWRMINSKQELWWDL